MTGDVTGGGIRSRDVVVEYDESDDDSVTAAELVQRVMWRLTEPGPAVMWRPMCWTDADARERGRLPGCRCGLVRDGFMVRVHVLDVRCPRHGLAGDGYDSRVHG